MGRILTPILALLAWPKKVIQIDEDALNFLDGKTAHILFAVGEAVTGEDFRVKVPHFIPLIDEYLAYQRRQQREAFRQGLLLVENALANLVFGGRLRGFSHMSIADRQRVLEHLKGSDTQLLRNLYAAFVNVSASAYYASEATWKDIHYDGVSVDHPPLLQVARWRSNDPRPVEP
ncbi:MAG: hypothetical protein ACR2GW_04305 [Pyrinomonadaceae bacterium]